MSTSNYDIEPTPAMLECVLVQDMNSHWFRFSLWTDRIFIIQRRQEWKNWAHFDESWFDDADSMFDLHELYFRMYGRNAAKNAHKKTLTKAIWVKWHLASEDRTHTYITGGRTDTGERERKRILDRRGYRVLEGESNMHLQNQALIVHRELLKLGKALKKEIITEAEVMDMMTRLRDSGILKTKQDPFRIFQYYRPALIKAGKLEFVE